MTAGELLKEQPLGGERMLAQLQDALRLAGNEKARMNASLNVTRTEALLRLETLHTAMQRAAQAGDFAAFLQMKDQYQQGYALEQAKHRAARADIQSRAAAVDNGVKSALAGLQEQLDATSAESDTAGYVNTVGEGAETEAQGQVGASVDGGDGGILNVEESGSQQGSGESAKNVGGNPKFRSWDDFSGYMLDVGKDPNLTIAEKVQKLQKAYDGVADKTDINIPLSDKYIKGFGADGKIEYDWPIYLGFDKVTIKAISRDNLLPERWDRYGSMKGSNFSDVPAGRRYSYSERSLPYVENDKAYHTGRFNNATYFSKIDAIRSGDLDALNVMLESEGVPKLNALEFENVHEDYKSFIARVFKEDRIDVDATYGLKGNAAAWKDLVGGAGQIILPFDGTTLIKLGIIM